MSEIEEMENTVDEAIEAANEVNNILAQSGEGNGVAVQSVAESGTDEDPVLTTEQKKKAINLQDLIYIKKYIQNMAASLKSEVESNAEAAYLKKTDAETTYLKKTDAAVGATKLADGNGTMKLDASSTDDNILPVVGVNNAAKIRLGSGNYKFKEVWAESFKGKIDATEFLEQTRLTEGWVYKYLRDNTDGMTLKNNTYYLVTYFPEYFNDDGTAQHEGGDFSIAFTPFEYRYGLVSNTYIMHAFGIREYTENNNVKYGMYYLRINTTNPNTHDGINAAYTLYSIAPDGTRTSVTNSKGALLFQPFLKFKVV